jgi:hypothetical protein
LPDFPHCEVEFSTRVTAEAENAWSTEIAISGSYDGPTDFVASRAYRLEWTSDHNRLLERGIAMLERSSGELVASEWASMITVDRRVLEAFPRSGEIARIVISPFKLKGNSMSYEWHGTIAAQMPFPTQPDEY